jgi:2-dehydropantoate 2-reductase
MKVLVFGAGAIGQWIGANLLQAGVDVAFVGRAHFVAAARREGLHVQWPAGEGWHVQKVRAHEDAAHAAQGAPYDAIALCVKAYAVEAALHELRDAGMLAPHTAVICFQNGMGAEETVARFAGDARVIAGTLTSAVSLVDATTVKLERAKGGVGLAPLSVLPVGAGAGVGRIADAFSMAPLLNVTPFKDAGAMKWSKLLLNLVGNATSAIYRVRVADVLRDAELAPIEMAQLREAEAVMRAAGVRAVNLPGAPSAWFALAVRILPNALLRWTLQRFFANARGDKWPSFYYDALNRTGRSEVQWLNGAVGAWGRRVGVPTPVNDELTQKVLAAVKPEATEHKPGFPMKPGS